MMDVVSWKALAAHFMLKGKLISTKYLPFHAADAWPFHVIKRQLAVSMRYVSTVYPHTLASLADVS